MKQATLHLELLDDVVLSARSASFGGHETLDYIPGATLLGWAASQLYAALNSEGLAFEAFHSGRLRFGNALPLDDHGAMALPVPRCWSIPKDQSPVDARWEHSARKRLDGVINNALVLERDPRDRTLRDGFVVPTTGEWLKPSRTLRMRTAINPDTGRAATGQLFGYESLKAGQRFRALLSADDNLDQTLFDRVRDRFDQATLRLGRSRSAQYGRARCRVGNAPDPIASTSTDTGKLILWLISDLAALDSHGQPTLTPDLSDLAPDLPHAPLAPSKCFVTTRRYSPYNGFRRAHDLERQVIEQGSVLSFDLEHPLTPAQRQLLESGLGAYREAGLGAVMVNPALLTDNSLTWPTEIRPTTTTNHPAPKHELVNWLQNQYRQATNTTMPTPAEDRETLAALYQAACRIAGAPDEVCVGPGPSQWGNLTQAATALRDQPKQLMDRLFAERNGICRNKSGATWEVKTQLKHPEADSDGPPTDELGRTSFAQWLEYELQRGELDPVTRIHSLARAAKTVMSDDHRKRDHSREKAETKENRA
ncbi:MAG: hypothetical protein ACPGU7_13105 [Gammaproteobacteria bacterium]